MICQLACATMSLHEHGHLPDLPFLGVLIFLALFRVANPPAPYRAQNQENLEIPISESNNTLFDLQYGTQSKCPEMAI